MDLALYVFASSPKIVDKTKFLSFVATVRNIKVKDEYNLITPTFKLKTTEYVSGSNYCYCNTTGRYYYIESYTTVNGGITEINCRVDVLNTYKDAILSSSAYVAKSSDSLADDEKLIEQPFKLRADKETVDLVFPNEVFTNSGAIMLGLLP